MLSSPIYIFRLQIYNKFCIYANKFVFFVQKGQK